ncbi:unnamed protein product [Leuciscus chuanchicus]
MSSPTTKTEVGRLTGATAASGCLALKPPANTAEEGKKCTKELDWELRQHSYFSRR